MMQTAALSPNRRSGRMRSDEVVGLVIALGAHVVIVVALAVHVLRPAVIVPAPERVVVSLAQDVGLTSTAQEVSQEAQASVAPTLSDTPAPPQPKPQARPDTKRVSPVVNPRTSSQPTQRTPPAPVQKTGGASRIGKDFLPGKSEGNPDADAPLPASQIGSSDRADLRQAITAQLRPHWSAPNGLDAEMLSTVVTWRLNEDGSLAGSPSCAPTTGITDSNKPQAGRHCELAMRAVRTTRFNLPPKFYNLWKKLTWEFNKDLTQ